MESLLVPREAALVLRSSEGTLANWRCKRKGPPWIAIGGTIRYRESDLLAYIEHQRIDPENTVAGDGHAAANHPQGIGP